MSPICAPAADCAIKIAHQINHFVVKNTQDFVRTLPYEVSIQILNLKLLQPLNLVAYSITSKNACEWIKGEDLIFAQQKVRVRIDPLPSLPFIVVLFLVKPCLKLLQPLDLVALSLTSKKICEWIKNPTCALNV